MSNYGGMVVFNKDLDNDTRNITQIQFYVSLLRNIYTIQIITSFFLINCYIVGM